MLLSTEPHTFLSYSAPKINLIPIQPDTLICTSPLPGGNEGIGFENWS